MSVRMLTSTLVVFSLFAAVAVPAAAQTLYGSLTGNVTDATSAAVPGAKIEVLNEGTGIAKTAQTDERGVYFFNDLQPGRYKLTISAKAFNTRVVEGVIISQNTTLRVDAPLTVSQVQESVTVNASAVTLQTDRSDINNVIQSNQIVNLPLLNSQGRNFQGLYKILPGFTPPGEASPTA